MGLPKVRFILGQGGSGRASTNFDNNSLMIAYYSATSANSAYANIGNKIYTSLQDAVADGVVADFVEATAATSAQVVATLGALNETIAITFTNWDGTTITLANYTKGAGDTTVTLQATSMVAAVNANTYVTGFSATVGTSGAYTLIAPKRLGIWPNTKSVVNTISTGGTSVITNNAFTGGTASPLAIFNYQISEFFRRQPNAPLYFAIKLDTSSDNAAAYNTKVTADVISVSNLFTGRARQGLVYNPFRTFATSTLDAIKTARTNLFNSYIPAVFGYVGGFTGSLSAQVNVRTLTDEGVDPIIGQSLSGYGLELSKTQQSVICSGGAYLGDLSRVAVSESIGEPIAENNVSDGTECETPGFYDGTTYDSATSTNDTLVDQLYDFGYTFLRKFKGGYNGTYWVGAPCAVNPASDYAFMEDVRTIDKAIRGVYLGIVQKLNSKNKVNPNGTLAVASIADYTSKASAPLDAMVRDEDLNDFIVEVSETEIVAQTSTVPITISLQQQPLGRYITITIGFKATL